MTRELYIHIGYHKTGTTAIQNFLFNNRKKLLDNNILYPEIGLLPNKSHPLLPFNHMMGVIPQNVPPWYRALDKPIQSSLEVLKRLRDEIDKSKCNKVIISSEEFVYLSIHSETLQLLEMIREVFYDFKIRIICYVREPIDFLLSFYNQIIKGTGTAKFSDFVTSLLECNVFNYIEVIQYWEKVFGKDNISINYYDKSIEGKTYIQYFLSLLGVKEDILIPDDKTFNSSLKLCYLPLKRELNMLLDRKINNTKVRFFINHFYIKTFTSMPNIELLETDYTLVEKINSHYRKSLKELVSNYEVPEDIYKSRHHFLPIVDMSIYTPQLFNLFLQKTKLIHLLFPQLHKEVKKLCGF